MNRTYLNMKNLIEKKHYKDIDAVMSYLDLFVMMDRLTQDEYMELSLLADGLYTVPEAPTSPEVEAPPAEQ